MVIQSVESLNEVKDFYENLWIWNRFEEFYEKYPNHPCRYIHEETKERLEKFPR